MGVHAQPEGPGQGGQGRLVGFLEDPLQVPALVDLPHGKLADPFRGDVALGQHALLLEQRRGTAGLLAQPAEGLLGIIIVGIDHQKRVVAGKRFGRGHCVGRPPRFDLHGKVD